MTIVEPQADLKSTSAPRTIGDTATQHGVEPHVLRHWEDVGALRPHRTLSGHRRFGPEHDAQITLIQCGKGAGLTLDEITTMLHGAAEDRMPLLQRKIQDLERLAAQTETSIRLLRHALTCDAPGACTICTHSKEAFAYPHR